MNVEDEKFVKVFITLAVIFIILIILLFSSVYKINAGYRGVELTFGKPSEVVSQEGINFKIPIVQTVEKYEVRTQKIQTIADSASLDLQDVQTTVALNFHLDPGTVNKLHQEIGKDYKIRIIDPAIQESVKAATAKFSAENLIVKRPEVRNTMQNLLTEKLGKYHIFVDELNIENFQFSEGFDAAIELKVTAEQMKLKADNDLKRIIVEAEQIRTQADAEAYALLRKADAISQSKDVVQLKLIEVQEKQVIVQQNAVDKWNGILPMITGTGGIPFIDSSELTSRYYSNEITS